MDIAFTGDNGWSTNGFRLKINEKEAGVGPFKKKKKKKKTNGFRGNRNNFNLLSKVACRTIGN